MIKMPIRSAFSLKAVAFYSLVTLFLLIPLISNAVSDNTGPVISSVQCHEQGETLYPGDIVHFSCRVTDESGVGRISYAALQTPHSTLFIQSSSWIYNSETGLYEMEYTVKADDWNGEYCLSALSAEDIYQNSTHFDCQLIFYVDGAISDQTGPTISQVTCSESGQTLHPGETVHFYCKAYDDSGVQSIYFSSLCKPRYIVYLQADDWIYNEETDTYEMTYVIKENDLNGLYRLRDVSAKDVYNNVTSFECNISFYVEGAISDAEGPIISDIICLEEGKVLFPGQVAHFSCKVSDESGVNRISLARLHRPNNTLLIQSSSWSYNAETARYEMEYTVGASDVDGEYCLYEVHAEDIYKNSSSTTCEIIFYVYGDPHDHDIIIEPPVPPTVNESGLTEGQRCAICGHTIVQQKKIPPLSEMNVLHIPLSVKTIEEEAFAGISCNAVIIPNGCKYIEKNAFRNCQYLLFVQIPADTICDPNAFQDCPMINIYREPNE